MPKSPQLTPGLLVDIQKLFPPEHISKISALLLTYGKEAHEREVDRVHWGILSVSGNDIAMAKTDYRDLIVAAEYTRPRIKADHD